MRFEQMDNLISAVHRKIGACKYKMDRVLAAVNFDDKRSIQNFEDYGLYDFIKYYEEISRLEAIAKKLNDQRNNPRTDG